MRLPNLLEHESLAEALQQSDAWNSLLKLHCHPDAKVGREVRQRLSPAVPLLAVRARVPA